MLAIKKKVSLEFLGEEFKDASITFSSIPMKDYEALMDGPEEGKEALRLVTNTLNKYFMSGRVPNDKGEIVDMKVEELGELDSETVITIFQQLSGTAGGQENDPLASQSSKPSKTEQKPQ